LIGYPARLVCIVTRKKEAGIRLKEPRLRSNIITRMAFSLKNLLLLATIGLLTVSGIAKTDAAQNLAPVQTQLQWNGWNVEIHAIQFTDKITRSYGSPKMPDADSEFVYLKLTVKNSSHKGQGFIPQNALKIVIGNNAFDAEDIDPNFEYAKNIEPTLTRERECYFELPKDLVKDAFAIRFSGFLTDPVDVSVLVTAAPDPTTVPIPHWQKPIVDQENPVEEQISATAPEVTNVDIEKSADDNLNYAWAALSAKQKVKLRHEETLWVHYKDTLPIDKRIAELQNRAGYLWSLSAHIEE
jgi:hypothetical protein